jgi:cell division septation protein DedD
MSELHRYRITGGVFLIALSVILLPMLFDARGVESDPPAAVRFEPLQVETLPDLQLDESALADAEALDDIVDEDGFDSDTDTKVGHVVIDTAATVADGEGLQAVWGVQLASLSDRTNALALRDRVRDDGYPALLSETTRLTGVSTRVAVGPLLSRQAADDMQEELSARYGVDAIVVRLGS